MSAGLRAVICVAGARPWCPRRADGASGGGGVVREAMAKNMGPGRAIIIEPEAPMLKVRVGRSPARNGKRRRVASLIVKTIFPGVGQALTTGLLGIGCALEMRRCVAVISGADAASRATIRSDPVR